MVEININKEMCKGCQLCIAECERDVLSMSKEMNSQGYPVPVVSRIEQCTGCLRCAAVCPECCIEITREI